MKTIIIRDRSKHRYILTNTAMVETGRYTHHLLLRLDLWQALNNLTVGAMSSGGNVNVYHGTRVAPFTVRAFHHNSRIKIGCRLFYAKESNVLRRWAEKGV